MAEAVSKLAAFVFAHGEMASEILFHDVDEEGELPGLLPEEREVITRVMPTLRATWIDILTACREAMWKRASGHACDAPMHTGKTQASKMFENGEVRLPLLGNNAAFCGIVLEPWGKPQYHIYVWVWTAPRHRLAAEAAAEGVKAVHPGMWRNENQSFLLTLDAPQEGESYDAVADRAADALWSLARPIVDAVIAAQAGDPA